MRIVIIGGAGEMGSVAVEYLATRPECSEIVIADYNYDAAVQLKDQLANPKITAAQVDVTDRPKLLEVIKGASVVMNFAGPFYRLAHYVVEAAIEAKVNYVDVCDDYDATRKLLGYDKAAKEAGVSILICTGASPGITNLFARIGSDWLDEVEEIHTAWATGDTGDGQGEGSEEGAAVLLHLLHACAGTVPSFQNSEFVEVRPMNDAGELTVTFPDPLGKVTFYDIGHPEPMTIPYFINGVKTVTNKGSVMSYTKLIKNIVDLELWREEPVKIGNASVSPADFIVAFLMQNQHLMQFEAPIGAGGMYVSVKGTKNGAPKKFELMRISSQSMGESTAIPTAAGALLLGAGKITQKGVIAPECIEPALFIEELAKRPDPPTQYNSGLIIREVLENGELKVISSGKPMIELLDVIKSRDL
ncbi:Saccharopine dehydrogenase / Homospermidine synthase [Syntrophomonas zehnderi OL-4]|uniref:Saccharopine dehydrogenase / Homospermidine synthase n=1 Tax=Syntrophomonas zehnderi OL-4 TaxID=690567 RepID=A0A0E4GF63_9FIRM|nr:saccharopine dehydrogenase NADP-binding domain-containing protein [Syntrophomonas zehnderi]CFY02990.1 Saccharopine dehydrogenase / Homospermidine synthase [Syntrophomonas zehnderi OL-4]